MPHIFTIRAPEGQRWQPERALQLVDTLVYTFASNNIAFQIIADHARITWQVVMTNVNVSEVVRSIAGIYPEAHIEEQPIETFLRSSPLTYRYVVKYFLTAETYLAPIKHVTDIRASDPLAAVVGTMTHLQQGERIVYSLFVNGTDRNLYTF